MRLFFLRRDNWGKGGEVREEKLGRVFLKGNFLFVYLFVYFYFYFYFIFILIFWAIT